MLLIACATQAGGLHIFEGVFSQNTEDTVVVSHIQRIGCQPEKTTLFGSQSCSWSSEQGKENKEKSRQRNPPPLPMLLVRRIK